MQSFQVNSSDLLCALKDVSAASGSPKHVMLRDQLYFLSVEAENGRKVKASKIVHLASGASKPRQEGTFLIERQPLMSALEKSPERNLNFVNKSETGGLYVGLPNLRRIPAELISSDVPKGTAEEGSAWVSDEMIAAAGQIQHARGAAGSGCEDIVAVSSGTAKNPKWDFFCGNQEDMFAFRLNVPVLESTIKKERFCIPWNAMRHAWKIVPSAEGSETWFRHLVSGESELYRGDVRFSWRTGTADGWAGSDYRRIAEMFSPANMPVQCAFDKKMFLSALSEAKKIEDDGDFMWMFCDGEKSLKLGSGRKKQKILAAGKGGRFAVRVRTSHLAAAAKAVGSNVCGMFWHRKSSMLMIGGERRTGYTLLKISDIK